VKRSQWVVLAKINIPHKFQVKFEQARSSFDEKEIYF
jgi:hypothetical protein